MSDQLDLFGGGEEPTPSPPTEYDDEPRDRETAVATSIAGAHARNSDPATSHEAARALDIKTRCAEVLYAIWYPYKLWDFTDGELAARIPTMERAVVARRRKDLENLGIVIPKFQWVKGAAKQMSRTGVAGRSELVWTIHPTEEKPPPR